MKNINSTKYKIGSFLMAFLMAVFLGIAQDFPSWPVPDDASALQNPVADTKESLESGKAIYNLQCKACHGETAKGDGLIKSASLVSETFQAQSDGAVFWKLQEGRSQMPGFKALPEDQRWDVINYVRSFTKKRDDLIMKNAVLSLFFNEEGETKELTAKVEELTEDGIKTPAEGVKVNLAIQRYFGLLPVSGTSSFTNSKGELAFIFPNNIIGDENGELTIVASIEDMEFNPVTTQEQITWGQVNPNDYWSERRALWKNNEHVPLWLLTSFIVVALSIWMVIMYVALLVRKIKVEGDKFIS